MSTAALGGEAETPSLSVIIPARDEEGVLRQTVEGLLQALREHEIPHEVLIVDDGSLDSTPAVIGSLEARFPTVRHVRNDGPHGFGNAVRLGLANYQGDALVVVMADGSDSPKDLVGLYRGLSEESDMVFGSRFAAGAVCQGYPPSKLFLNRLGNGLVAVILRRRYDDFTNPFKCYRRYVIDAIQPLSSESFALSLEMSVKAVAAGYRFTIVPTDWHGRDWGSSSFRLWRDALEYLKTVIKASRRSSR